VQRLPRYMSRASWEIPPDLTLAGPGDYLPLSKTFVTSKKGG
jgi:hypothetical protein